MQKITPCLWFNDKAEEAMNFYTSIFKNSKQDGILRYGNNEAPDQEGKIKHAQAAFNGQKIMFMDSAQPHSFTFSEGVSLTLYCETQEEIDYYWADILVRRPAG